MSSSDQIQVSYVEESTIGTTPASAFDELPITGGSMAQGTNTVRSQQIRSDAQLAETKRVGVSPTASYNIELAAQTFDGLMEGAMRSSWSTAVNISGTDIAAAATGNKYTSTTTDLSTNVAAGQWVYVAGFTTAANNGWRRVTSASSTEMVVTGGTLVDEAAGDAVTVKGAHLRNGTDVKSYSLQEQFQDLTDKYKVITGAHVGSYNIDIAPAAIISGAFNFEGLGLATASAKAGNGTVNAAPSTSPMSEVDSFELVMIGDSTVSYDVVNLSFAANTNPRSRDALGQLGPSSVGLGAMDVSGSIEVYLEDNTWSLQQDYLDFTKFGLAFALKDAAGNRYVFDFPQVALSNEPGTIPGPSSDVMLSFDFSAEPGGSFDKTVQICRVTA